MALGYKPGDTVQKSGIYRVVHDSKHGAVDHEVTCVSGKRFPPCNHCGENVRFLLVRAARHIARHKYFA